MGKSARPTRPVAPARSAFREVASASAIRLLYARARCGGMGAASLRPSAPFEVPRTPFGVRDPLLQLSFPLPTAAVPRERPFSRGSLTGALGVRREKAALSSGCKPHPATAPAGSNRSRHGGDEMSEAFG